MQDNSSFLRPPNRSSTEIQQRYHRISTSARLIITLSRLNDALHPKISYVFYFRLLFLQVTAIPEICSTSFVASPT